MNILTQRDIIRSRMFNWVKPDAVSRHAPENRWEGLDKTEETKARWDGWWELAKRCEGLDPETITTEEFEAIFGQSSSLHRCHECGSYVDAVLGISADISGVMLCESCVRKGLSLFDPAAVPA